MLQRIPIASPATSTPTLAMLATIAVTLIASAANAQTSCQSAPLPFDANQVGVIDQSDCTVSRNGRDVTGEDWTLLLGTGDFLLVDLGRRSVQDEIVVFLLDSVDNVVGQMAFVGVSWDRTSIRKSFTAPAPGTFRFFVTDLDVSRTKTSSSYTIRVHRVTVPEPYLQQSSFKRNEVRLSWGALSASPVLEYVLEVGSSPGARDHGVFYVGTVTEVVTSAAVGKYFVRVWARNVYGWGAALEDAVVTVRAPSAPSVFWYSAAGHVSLEISRVEDRPPEAFELLIGSAPGQSDLGMLIVPAAAQWKTTFDVYGVPAGHYYVRVRVLTSDGPGDFSEEKVIVVH